MSETIRVGSFPLALGGERVEAEEQPVERVLSMPIPVDLGMANPDGGPPISVGDAGTMGGGIITSETALEAAKGMLRQCQHCANYEPAGWQLAKRQAEAVGGREAFDQLNAMRGVILDLQGNASTAAQAFVNRHRMAEGLAPEINKPQFSSFDVEAALNDLGCCRALEELDPNKEWHFLLPTMRCPVGGEWMFQPTKGRAAAREAVKGYDEVLNLARRNL